MLTQQANEHASREGKNTISEAHAAAALDELGFGHYRGGADSSATDGAAAAPGERKRGGKRKQRGGPPSGLSEEELLRMQQALFAEARRSVQG